jgi:hypothetical protein
VLDDFFSCVIAGDSGLISLFSEEAVLDGVSLRLYVMTLFVTGSAIENSPINLNSEVVRLICGGEIKKVPSLRTFLRRKIIQEIYMRRSNNELVDKES